MSRRPPLNSIVRQSLFEAETPAKIKRIWNTLHRKQDTVVAVLESDQYHKMRERAREAPLFVFPLPKGVDGAFVSYLWQSVEDDVHLYTELESYKLKGEAADVALTCCFYTELMETKGVVLMHGKALPNLLQSTEAGYLASSTSLFLNDDSRYKLMQQFNKDPQAFNFDSVLENKM